MDARTHDARSLPARRTGLVPKPWDPPFGIRPAIRYQVRVLHRRCDSITGRLRACRNPVSGVLRGGKRVGHDAEKRCGDQHRRDKCKHANRSHRRSFDLGCGAAQSTQGAKRAYFALGCAGFQLKWFTEVVYKVIELVGTSTESWKAWSRCFEPGRRVHDGAPGEFSPGAPRIDAATCWTYHCHSSYDFRNPQRSSLIVAASVVGMPWGKPL